MRTMRELLRQKTTSRQGWVAVCGMICAQFHDPCDEEDAVPKYYALAILSAEDAREFVKSLT